MEVLMQETDQEIRQWKFISEMQGDIKVVFTRLDTIENEHLTNMKGQINELDRKLWMILMVVFAQLFAIVGGLVVFLVT
jgi:GTP-binding protein EngB required for normal cell division